MTAIMPSAPMLARTVSMPCSQSSRAASITSPTVRRVRPTAEASSSAFGLIMAARPLRAQMLRGSPEVSSATRTPRASMRSKIGVRSTKVPVVLFTGSAPATTSHFALFSRTVRSVSSTMAFQSCSLSGRGDSFTLVVGPLCSTIVVETRRVPSTQSGNNIPSLPVRARTPGSELPIGTTPGALMPAKKSPRETLIPFPASSSPTASARLTPPECRLLTK